MNNVLDLDQYFKDLEVKLYGKVYHMPVIKKDFASKVLKIFAPKHKATEEEIYNILLEFLNSNKEKELFTREMLEEDLTTRHRKALINFIISEITAAEKK